MLEDCARQVNEQMLAVRAAGRVIAIDQIAVLTALELAYDAKKREHDAKKTAAASPQTPPQPVQQQTPAAAVPTAAIKPQMKLLQRSLQKSFALQSLRRGTLPRRKDGIALLR